MGIKIILIRQSVKWEWTDSDELLFCSLIRQPESWSAQEFALKKMLWLIASNVDDEEKWSASLS